MNKRKILLLALAASIIAILAVGGTLAYFTAEENVTNTFAVGDVKITLTESKVTTNKDEADPEVSAKVSVYGYFDADGEGVRSVSTKNEYENLMPGATVWKDPTVENVSASQNPAYIRVKIKHNKCDAIKEAFGDDDYLDVLENRVKDNMYVSTIVEDDDPKAEALGIEEDERMYILRFKEPLPYGEKIMLFESISIPAEFDHDEMKAFKGLKIKIKAEAIQTTGFANSTEAFEAFDEQAE